jgi:hypothetical protein
MLGSRVCRGRAPRIVVGIAAPGEDDGDSAGCANMKVEVGA